MAHWRSLARKADVRCALKGEIAKLSPPNFGRRGDRPALRRMRHVTWERSSKGEIMAIIARAACAASLLAFVSGAALAQDAVKVDPKHYKVITENAQVRVLHIHYGPHETSVRHSHPNSVVTYLSDGDIKFVLGNGKTVTTKSKAGDAVYTPAGIHTPTNLSDKPFDAVLVELKGPAAGKK